MSSRYTTIHTSISKIHVSSKRCQMYTISTQKMKEPKQDTLQFANNQLSFHPECKPSSKSINDMPLKDLLSNIKSLVHNHKIFKGWKQKQLILIAWHLQVTSNLLCYNIILYKLSTKESISLSKPTLNQNHKLLPSDKKSGTGCTKKNTLVFKN